MKKILIWVSLGLMCMGVALFCCVGVSVGFDLSRLDNMTYITNSHNIQKEVTSIILTTVTADIDFRPSEDGKCRVVCYEPENIRHDVSVTDGVMMISWVDQRNWLDRLTVLNFHTPTITVYLPEGVYQSLKVNNTTGDININGEWNFIDVSLSTTTGDIHAGGLTCSSDVTVQITTGDLKLENVSCNNLIAEGSTGDTQLSFVTASSILQIKRTTGDIELYRCDGHHMHIKTTTGDVTGTILTPKLINARSTSGNVDVPSSTSGGHCEIETTTGDICIKIH